jgi:spoIIIJ-associated protein
MKKYTYQAKTFEEAKNMALAELMEQQENLYIKEIESSTKLFSKKSVIEVVKKEDVLEYIKEMIKNITKFMGLTVNMEVKKRDDNVTISLYSDNNAILIGKDARTLNALTTIIKQSIFNQIGTYYNFVLDVSEYKEKQQFFIERAAKKTAKEVARTKIEAKLEPMNSYERRIVHNVLTNFRGVYTESEGVEPHRYVVIKPKLNETKEEEKEETTE